MQSFRQYLREDHPRDEEVQAVIDEINADINSIYAQPGRTSKKVFKDYRLENGQVVFLGEELKISSVFLDSEGELMIPFKSCQRLVVGGSSLKSFKNFPITVNGYSLSSSQWSISNTPLYNCKHITSLEGFPRFIEVGTVDFGHQRYEKLSFSHVNKYISRLNGRVHLLESYSGPLLGFFLVEGLTSITFNLSADPHVEELRRLLNRLLIDHTDMLDAKEELMTNGFKEYAKL